MTPSHSKMPIDSWGEPLESADYAVITVHGRGQDTAFMRELSDRMDAPGAAFVAPQASAHSWYPLSFLAEIEENQPELDDALGVIDGLRSRLADQGFGPERTVLLGFSQGACLVSHYLIGHPAPYRALIALTGGFIGALGSKLSAPGRLEAVPVFLGTAAEDDWVPLARVEETASLLTALGADVELSVDPGGEHLVSERSIRAVNALLARLAGE